MLFNRPLRMQCVGNVSLRGERGVVAPRAQETAHEREIAIPQVEIRVRQADRSGSPGWRSTWLLSGRRLRSIGGTRLPAGVGGWYLDRGDQFGYYCGKRAARSCRKTSHILGAGFVSHGELARSAARRLAGLDAAAERVVCADVRPAWFFPTPVVLRRPAT